VIAPKTIKIPKKPSSVMGCEYTKHERRVENRMRIDMMIEKTTAPKFLTVSVPSGNTMVVKRRENAE